jgi:hypothetical protein
MCKFVILDLFLLKKHGHYKIKVLVINRFNYYEIMLINFVLNIYMMLIGSIN